MGRIEFTKVATIVATIVATMVATIRNKKYMLKKILIIAVGIILLLIISSVLIYEVSSAADIKTVCEFTTLNDYLTPEKKGSAYKDFEKALQTNDGYSNDLKARIAFEKARAKYHDTIKCVFDVSAISILGSTRKLGDNIKKDNYPDLEPALADLLKPDKVCALWPERLTEIIDEKKPNSNSPNPKSNSPEILIKPILESYNKYSAFINYILSKIESYPTISGSSSNVLVSSYDNLDKLKLIMGNEITDSLVALDAAFTGLKELRLSFVMHVHFECMLKNLEIYRRMLASLRTIVSTLPSVIEDASMHK